MECPRCQSNDLVKRGCKEGYQRYCCRQCGRYSTDRAPRFSAQTKARAVEMYLNNVGIRKIARFVGASPAGVLRWIGKEHRCLQARLAAQPRADPGDGDVIEMDEIYTFVQKNGSAP